MHRLWSRRTHQIHLPPWNRSDPENLRRCPVDVPETPDTDELTYSEFRSLEEMAQNPRFDSKLRSDAAMLMIFGTHRT